MLRIMSALIFSSAVSVSAAVVSSSGINDDLSWWREGQTSPYSFGELDADRDGKISSGELNEARRQYAKALKETKASLMNAIDLDHSGKLSRYEASEGSPRLKSLREFAVVLARAENDANGDGKVDEKERMSLETRLGMVFQRYGVALVDTNKDKNFSRSEIDKAALAIKEGKGALFRYCDISNDGQISVREANLAFDLFAAAAGLSRY
jgi:hypothetical protein